MKEEEEGTIMEILLLARATVEVKEEVVAAAEIPTIDMVEEAVKEVVMKRNEAVWKPRDAVWTIIILRPIAVEAVRIVSPLSKLAFTKDSMMSSNRTMMPPREDEDR